MNPMPAASLDAFQVLIAFYLFYTAIKGSGTLYNFPGIPKKKAEAVHRNLRIIYTAAGFISLLDGAVSMLENSMFTVNYTEEGAEIVQNYTIGALPFITYDLLRSISFGCIIAILILLAGLFIYVRKQQKN